MALAVEWLGHATVLIELGGTRLITDPVLGRRVGPLIRVAPAINEAATWRIDAVLLSHLHADHTQPRSLRRLPGAPAVLAPDGAAAWLRRNGIANVRELRAGQELRVGAVHVRAVPATHDGRRRPLGPIANPIGYVVERSRAVYFAGDTDLFPAMADLNGTVDIALLPVWGWGPTLGPGHLDPRRAARAAALIAPRVAIPIHWGTFALSRSLRGRAASDEPARQFAEFAAREAPAVEVRVLRPGARTVLD